MVLYTFVVSVIMSALSFIIAFLFYYKIILFILIYSFLLVCLGKSLLILLIFSKN